MKITLSWSEVFVAAEMGVRRQARAYREGYRDDYGRGMAPGWTEHIEGAAGELVVARLLNQYPDLSSDSFKGADLGSRIQVRTRCDLGSKGTDLGIRPTDDNAAVFVLAVGHIPTFDVRGWIRGGEAKRPEWFQKFQKGGGVYFVPASALKPIEELMGKREAA